MGGPHHVDVARISKARALVRLVHAAPVVAILEEAGYEVGAVEDFEQAHDVTEPDEPFVIICEGRDERWLRAIADLKAKRPAALVVYLSDIESADEFMSAIAAGVDGFCSPRATPSAILRTIRDVEASGAAVPRSMVSSLIDHVRHGRGRTIHTAAGAIDVTDREWEVVQLLLQRRSTREMANALFVSVGTVRSHVSALLGKLGAVDREDVIDLIERGRRH